MQQQVLNFKIGKVGIKSVPKSFRPMEPPPYCYACDVWCPTPPPCARVVLHFPRLMSVLAIPDYAVDAVTIVSAAVGGKLGPLRRKSAQHKTKVRRRSSSQAHKPNPCDPSCQWCRRAMVSGYDAYQYKRCWRRYSPVQAGQQQRV